jgi:hypothetical protein
MRYEKIIKIIKDRYISAHCNPDFKGDKFSFIFAPIEVDEPLTQTEISDNRLYNLIYNAIPCNIESIVLPDHVREEIANLVHSQLSRIKPEGEQPVSERKEETITIPKWQFEKIEDVLRQTNNIHHSQNKETCFDRSVCKAWQWACEALGKEYGFEPVSEPESISAEEIYKWLRSKNYQTEYEETGEYKMYFEVDMPKILEEYAKFKSGGK